MLHNGDNVAAVKDLSLGDCLKMGQEGTEMKNVARNGATSISKQPYFRLVLKH